MKRFVARIVAGRKAPYTTWNFVEVPADVAAALGHGPVRGTLAGTPFRGTASRSGGVLRVPVVRGLLEQSGLARGDRVVVTLERDAAPRPIAIPLELQDVLGRDRALAEAFAAMAPSHRRAWAQHVGEAKRAETRRRRAAKAPDGIRRREFPR